MAKFEIACVSVVAVIATVGGAAGCRHHGYYGAPQGQQGWYATPQPQPMHPEQPAPQPAPVATAPQTVDDPLEAEVPYVGNAVDDESADITGGFKVKGSNATGGHYEGTAFLARIQGNMYEGTWKIGDSTIRALMFRDRNLISCGNAPKKDLGVMAYLVHPGQMDGLWFEQNHTTTGYEKLTRTSDSADLGGFWNIAVGETPAKKKYKGTVQVTRYQSGVYAVDWTFQSGLVLHGLGLRSWKLPGAKQDILSVGFNGAGDATVLQFVVQNGGKKLRGHWAQPNAGGAPTWGVETLERL